MGWFGFNGGSQLAMGSIGDIADVSRIFVNTNMAAAATSIVGKIFAGASRVVNAESRVLKVVFFMMSLAAAFGAYLAVRAALSHA